MKLKSLITLYVTVAVLAAGVFIAKSIQNAEEDSSARHSRGYKPFQHLSPGEVAEIQLIGAENTSTIKIHDQKWVVAERENYPVKVSALQSLLRKIQELSVAQDLEAGESFNPRFGMDENSSDPETHGTKLLLKKASGEEIAQLKIGKDLASAGPTDPLAGMMGGGNQSSGKYIRLTSDPNSVYVINDALSEAQTHPKEWLSEDFIQVKKITSISLSPKGNPEAVEWTLSRPDITEPFSLEGALPEGKQLNMATINGFNNILAFARFEDVVSEKAAQGLRDKNGTQRARIKTEDGFSYELEISPKAAEGSENYLMTIKVSAELKTEREKPKEETEEVAKTMGAAFQKTLKENQEQLKREQALQGRVYEVTPYTVQALLKGKADLLQDTPPAAATPAPAVSEGALQPRLTPRQITTPPVRVPGQ